jgi:hypothetical protein
MLWAVAFPAVQEGPLPQVVVFDLLDAWHTAFPLEQTVLPVWQSGLGGVHAAPALHALQVPVLSHTPAVDPFMQVVARGTVLHVPVLHEWQVPQAVAQQTPPTQ